MPAGPSMMAQKVHERAEARGYFVIEDIKAFISALVCPDDHRALYHWMLERIEQDEKLLREALLIIAERCDFVEDANGQCANCPNKDCRNCTLSADIETQLRLLRDRAESASD